jgi:dihydroorotase
LNALAAATAEKHHTSTSSMMTSTTENDETPSSYKTIQIPIPDDFHHHLRDGIRTKSILSHVIQRFGRALIMPNLKPPITTADAAMDYRDHILQSLPLEDSTFVPLMTLYLTDKTTAEDIYKAHETKYIKAVKYYPAGATTNSDYGVTHVQNTYDALRAMEECGMILCIHSEVSDPVVDIFDREGVFIREIMVPLLRDFPSLKIVMEHISTQEAVEFVQGCDDRVAATITPHHLLYNRNGKNGFCIQKWIHKNRNVILQ